jgi:hypothetical protein
MVTSDETAHRILGNCSSALWLGSLQGCSVKGAFDILIQGGRTSRTPHDDANNEADASPSISIYV